MAKRITPRNERMLTAKEARFVAAYFDSDSAAEAGRRAGVNNPTKMLARPHVSAEVERRVGAMLAKRGITLERVLNEVADVAFHNLDDFLQEDYTLGKKPGRRQMAAVKEIVISNDGDGGTRTTLKMHDKMAALDKLLRHMGAYKDSIKVDSEIVGRLKRAIDKLAREPQQIEGEVIEHED